MPQPPPGRASEFLLTYRKDCLGANVPARAASGMWKLRLATFRAYTQCDRAQRVMCPPRTRAAFGFLFDWNHVTPKKFSNNRKNTLIRQRGTANATFASSNALHKLSQVSQSVNYSVPDGVECGPWNKSRCPLRSDWPPAYRPTALVQPRLAWTSSGLVAVWHQGVF